MKKFKFILLLISIFVISCTEKIVENNDLLDITETAISNKVDAQVLINNIAKLSVNQAFKELVHEEVSKKFDGANNVLLTNLNNCYNSIKLKSASIDQKYETVISSLKEKGLYPQIYIPQFEEARLKSAKNESIVYIIDGFDTNDTIKQFKSVYIDENGEMKETDFLIDEDFAKNNEVWVVSYNERVDNEGKIIEDNTLKSARVGTKSEYMMKIKCPDLSRIESWIKGPPELRCIMKSAKGEISDQFFYPSERSYINNTWWEPAGSTGRYLYYWDIETYTKTVLFYWVEVDDAGKTHTYSNSFTYKDIDKLTGQEYTSVSNYSFTYVGYDILCGSISVHIDDGHIGEVYSTGLVEWINDYR